MKLTVESSRLNAYILPHIIYMIRSPNLLPDNLSPLIHKERKSLLSESYQKVVAKMDIDQIINQIDSQITGGIRKKATIFDLGPKERFQMLKEVNKYKIRQANLNAGKPGKSYLGFL